MEFLKPAAQLLAQSGKLTNAAPSGDGFDVADVADQLEGGARSLDRGPRQAARRVRNDHFTGDRVPSVLSPHDGWMANGLLPRWRHEPPRRYIPPVERSAATLRLDL